MRSIETRAAYTALALQLEQKANTAANSANKPTGLLNEVADTSQLSEPIFPWMKGSPVTELQPRSTFKGTRRLLTPLY